MGKKKEKKKQKPLQLWKLYEVKGDTLTRKSKWSPKKGSGYFMAGHKDRQTCGATGYTEFKKSE